MRLFPPTGCLIYQRLGRIRQAPILQREALRPCCHDGHQWAVSGMAMRLADFQSHGFGLQLVHYIKMALM
jgi:hypothetical protein